MLLQAILTIDIIHSHLPYSAYLAVNLYHCPFTPNGYYPVLHA